MKQLLLICLLIFGSSSQIGCCAKAKETPDTVTPDTETPDTETPDTETPDTEIPDTETPDTETPDTETPDTETSDTETPDTETPDTETPDTETPDTETPVPRSEIQAAPEAADQIALLQQLIKKQEELIAEQKKHIRKLKKDVHRRDVIIRESNIEEFNIWMDESGRTIREEQNGSQQLRENVEQNATKPAVSSKCSKTRDSTTKSLLVLKLRDPVYSIKVNGTDVALKSDIKQKKGSGDFTKVISVPIASRYHRGVRVEVNEDSWNVAVYPHTTTVLDTIANSFIIY